MSLSVGIVGLPNVGKSTLFNALLKRQQAYVANFPFATIEPNVGVVPVPDERLKQLSQVIKESEKMDHFPPEVPATVEFLDIAGLIAGAHKGEGLGNKFLSHIRNVDAICHVVRSFRDEDIVKEGSIDPVEDFEIIETELKLADLQTVEKQKYPGLTPNKELHKHWQVVVKLKEALQKNIAVRELTLNDEEKKVARGLGLLTAKPILIALNIDENDLINCQEIESEFSQKVGTSKDQVVAICAKTEAELADLTEEEALLYLNDLGISQTPLERLVQKAFSSLGLITFLTAGEKEVRAWTIRKNSTAVEASGAIHTDFEKNFIKADVCKFDDYITFGGWKEVREAGKVRSEGKAYIMQDGDVVEFKIGSS